MQVFSRRGRNLDAQVELPRQASVDCIKRRAENTPAEKSGKAPHKGNSARGGKLHGLMLSHSSPTSWVDSPDDPYFFADGADDDKPKYPAFHQPAFLQELVATQMHLNVSGGVASRASPRPSGDRSQRRTGTGNTTKRHTAAAEVAQQFAAAAPSHQGSAEEPMHGGITTFQRRSRKAATADSAPAVPNVGDEPPAARQQLHAAGRGAQQQEQRSATEACPPHKRKAGGGKAGDGGTAKRETRQTCSDAAATAPCACPSTRQQAKRRRVSGEVCAPAARPPSRRKRQQAEGATTAASPETQQQPAAGAAAAQLDVTEHAAPVAQHAAAALRTTQAAPACVPPAATQPMAPLARHELVAGDNVQATKAAAADNSPPTVDTQQRQALFCAPKPLHAAVVAAGGAVEPHVAAAPPVCSFRRQRPTAPLGPGTCNMHGEPAGRLAAAVVGSAERQAGPAAVEGRGTNASAAGESTVHADAPPVASFRRRGATAKAPAHNTAAPAAAALPACTFARQVTAPLLPPSEDAAAAVAAAAAPAAAAAKSADPEPLAPPPRGQATAAGGRSSAADPPSQRQSLPSSQHSCGPTKQASVPAGTTSSQPRPPATQRAASAQAPDATRRRASAGSAHAQSSGRRAGASSGPATSGSVLRGGASLPALLGYRAGCTQWRGRDHAPPSTITEAQEKGCALQLVDDATYALDGLAPGAPLATRQDCALRLLKLAMQRRGRLALRADGLLHDIVTEFARAAAGGDAALVLAGAALVLALIRPDGDADAAGSDAALQCISHALAHDALTDQATSALAGRDPCAAVARVRKLVADGQLLEAVPEPGAACAESLALRALAEATHPQSNAALAEKLKGPLRERGLLAGVAAALVRYGDQLPDCRQESGRAEHGRALWGVAACCEVLEHASFASPDNERHLAGLKLRQQAGQVGGGADGPKTGLTAWLVKLLPRLCLEGRSNTQQQECAHSCIALLMNLTQSNTDGCAAVAGAGGARVAAHVLADACTQLAAPAICTAGSSTAGDTVCVTLGLLINLVEGAPETRAELAAMELPPSQQQQQQGGAQALLPLLCTLLQRVSSSDKGHDAGGEPEGGCGEVTVESLSERERQGVASIIEVYVSILLGFLLCTGPAALKAALPLLPGRSLAAVVGPVQRALNFYVATGAMTDANERSLRNLLAQLQLLQGGAADEGGGGGGGADGV